MFDLPETLFGFPSEFIFLAVIAVFCLLTALCIYESNKSYVSDEISYEKRAELLKSFEQNRDQFPELKTLMKEILAKDKVTHEGYDNFMNKLAELRKQHQYNELNKLADD